jgi:hypothetical protein
MMKIQINTDNHIEGSEELTEQTEAIVKSSLGHLSDHITRLELHLRNENNDKGGTHNKRCMMEARLKGHQPIAVTHEAKTIDQAVSGAVEKLKHSLDHTLGRLHHN